jgi:hypothetical protein
MQKLLYFLLLLPASLLAQGGMWLPLNLEKVNEKEMKALGCKLDADAIYNINKPSLKDAVCQFDGGCTAEMISPQGLLLTNHHCGFGAIQQLSTLEHNYVEDGYWAKTHADELPAPGVTAMFVRRMEDVTLLALMDVVEGMGEKDRQAQIDKNIVQIRANTKKEKWEETMVRSFYNGNQYFLFVTVTFTDLRLVGTPPSSIGKFGSDTDNWVWPRHTGDFSMFRIYADKDNHPAPYNTNNVPYVPGHFLPISLDGMDEGDFTMVYGFPGRTDEYLSAAAVQQMGGVLDPARVSVRDRALKILDSYMRKDPAVKIAYIAKYASIANAWKKWQGEMLGLKTYKAFEKKAAYETEFTNRINGNTDWKFKYGNLLPRLNQLIHEVEPYALARDYYLEACVRNNEILSLVAGLNSWIESSDKSGGVGFNSKFKETQDRLDAFYKDYHPEVDQSVFTGLLQLYAENTKPEWGGAFVKEEVAKQGDYAGFAAYLFKNSVFPDKAKMKALFQESPERVAAALKSDPAYVFYKRLNELYTTNVQPKLQELTPNINLLQRQYMAAQMVVFKEKRFFPDANSTLRLTYGPVRGYAPRDAVQYQYQSYLDGVMEKYIPGDYEFDVPKRLIELWQTKDYGRYADANGKLPVAFLGANHTTGGNSGSPAIDARGNLVGLNFDRVWEGTMSDLNYDPAICRNIMVDVRYVLFIVDKYAGAGHLLQEMQLVQGQKKHKKKK